MEIPIPDVDTRTFRWSVFPWIASQRPPQLTVLPPSNPFTSGKERALIGTMELTDTYELIS